MTEQHLTDLAILSIENELTMELPGITEFATSDKNRRIVATTMSFIIISMLGIIIMCGSNGPV